MRNLTRKEINEVCGSGASNTLFAESSSWGNVIYNALAKQIRSILESLWGSLY